MENKQTHIAISKPLHKKLNIMKATEDDCKSMTDVIEKLIANQKK